MHDWRKNVDKKNKKQSHTSGKSKGEACMASPLERFVAKRSRSYKHKSYATVLSKWDRKLSGGSAKK